MKAAKAEFAKTASYFGEEGSKPEALFGLIHEFLVSLSDSLYTSPQLEAVDPADDGSMAAGQEGEEQGGEEVFTAGQLPENGVATLEEHEGHEDGRQDEADAEVEAIFGGDS